MRNYFFGGPLTRTVKIIIFSNFVAYLLQIAFHLFGSDYLDFHFGLVPYRVTHDYMLWQFVTYMFLHGSPFHIFFNMLTLFMFGNDLERYWGTRLFVFYYFVTGIGAGVCSWLVATNSFAIIIGASGAVYGLLLAYGITYPDRIVYFNFLLPVKVKWMVLIMGGFAFLSSLTGSEGGVASIAHLGGMVVGYLFLKGSDWARRYRQFAEHQRREQLKRQFEVYYGDVRRKIEQDKKKGPTVH